MLSMEHLGGRIAALRRRQGLTQNHIAQACCVSVQAVSKWERGLSCPDILILDDLAHVLGVEIQDLFLQDDAS